jgi:type II secretory pathway pseudopilin PulG
MPKARRPGFTTIELIILLAIVGIVVLFAAAYLRSIFHRERLKRVVRDIHALVVAARAQAVRGHQTCVVSIDPASRQIKAWQDLPPENYTQDAGEPTLLSMEIPPSVVLRAAPDGGDGVAFDGYLGKESLVDRIVFKPDGSIDAPAAPNSQPPVKPALLTRSVPAGSINCNPNRQCRGIYVADNDRPGDLPNRNTFRISVDDFGPGSQATLLKWLPSAMGGNRGEVNYVPPPWKWVD